MTHHPHLHMIVPGGGISMDDSRWISCKPNFLLPVRVLSKLFRRLMLEKLVAAHGAGRLQFLGSHAHLADAKMFAAFLAPLVKKRWFIYAKRPFAGPKAVLCAAGSFPGGFRTTAPAQADTSRWAVIRNPSHERTSGTLPNRSKTRSYGARGHLAFWGEGVRLRGGECA
jgi:hypothetical protein